MQQSRNSRDRSVSFSEPRKRSSGYIKPAVNVVKEISSYYLAAIYRWLLSSRNDKKYYQFLMNKATSYEQWAAAGYMLDRVEGNDEWKNQEESNDYDYELLKDRLNILRTIRKNADLPAMVFNLRTSHSRNLAGMGREALYEKSHVGTKVLIEDYIDEFTKQLNFICDVDINGMTVMDKLHFFRDIQKSFGRTALLFSGGGSFGLSHVGPIKVLAEQNLLPKIITGSSSGSIVAAVLCCQEEKDLWALADTSYINMDFFCSRAEGNNLFMMISRFIKHGVIYDVEAFHECMKANIGDITFLEAYNRSRRILNITVSSSTSFEMPRVLNYLTAPNVLVRSAVAASCALPIIFKSAPLMAKDAKKNIVPWNPSGHRWVDGSIEGDIPMQRVRELFGVNHYLVAQVNPHIIPFLNYSGLKSSYIGKGIKFVGKLVQDEVQHRLSQLIDLGFHNFFLIKAYALLSQTYVGDITIVPNLPLSSFPKVMTSVQRDFALETAVHGERATWPKIAILRNHMSIEQCLSKILMRLREQLIDEIIQVDTPIPLGVRRRSSFSKSNERLLANVGKMNSDPDINIPNFNSKADFLELPLHGPTNHDRAFSHIKLNKSAGDVRAVMTKCDVPVPVSTSRPTLRPSIDPIFQLDLTYEDSEED